MIARVLAAFGCGYTGFLTNVATVSCVSKTLFVSFVFVLLVFVSLMFHFFLFRLLLCHLFSLVFI